MTAVIMLFVCAAVVAAPNTEQHEDDIRPVSIQISENGKVNLRIMDQSRGKVNVSIFKSSGVKVFDENISYNKSFVMPIDLSNQDQGNFRFVVKKDDEKYVQEVFNSKMSENDIHASMEELSSGMYNLKIRHNNVPVKIVILDKEGQRLFSKTYIKASNFQQVFDLSRIKDEDLTVSISGQKSYIRFNL